MYSIHTSDQQHGSRGNCIRGILLIISHFSFDCHNAVGMSRAGSKRRKAELSDDEYVEESYPRAVVVRERGSSRNKRDTQDNDVLTLQDYSHLTLKRDHAARPLWVTTTGLIILEAFSPIYQQAYDFLVAIAEPVSRPEYIHRYQLTANSLYAAVAISIRTETIIQVLNRLCKTELPSEVVSFIKESTATYGEAKLVLKDNKYFVESRHPDVLRFLLRQPVIAAARITDTGAESLPSEFTESAAPVEMQQNLAYSDIGRTLEAQDRDDMDDDVMQGTMPGSVLKNVSFMINQNEVQNVKRCAQDCNYPLMEEYDFRNDTRNPQLQIDLRPSTKIRVNQILMLW